MRQASPAIPLSRTQPVGDTACHVPREVLDLIANKWSLILVGRLSHGPRRFTELRRDVVGISQRMLTVTLRNLERYGMLVRAEEEESRHVRYQLTPLGAALAQAAEPLMTWTADNRAHLEARQRGLGAGAAQR